MSVARRGAQARNPHRTCGSLAANGPGIITPHAILRLLVAFLCFEQRRERRSAASAALQLRSKRRSAPFEYCESGAFRLGDNATRPARMTYRDRRLCDMVIRVHGFGAAHGARFPESSAAQAAFAVVAAKAAQMEKLRITLRLVAPPRAGTKAGARRALFRCLTRARNTARVLVKSVPQLAGCVALREVTDDRLLLAIARQFAAAAAEHRDQFASAGFAVEDLNERIDAFVAADNALTARRHGQLHARRDMAAALASAMEAVETLDVVVPNHLASDPVTLAQWTRERQVYFNRWSDSAHRRRVRRGRVGRHRGAVSA